MRRLGRRPSRRSAGAARSSDPTGMTIRPPLGELLEQWRRHRRPPGRHHDTVRTAPRRATRRCHWPSAPRHCSRRSSRASGRARARRASGFRSTVQTRGPRGGPVRRPGSRWPVPTSRTFSLPVSRSSSVMQATMKGCEIVCPSPIGRRVVSVGLVPQRLVHEQMARACPASPPAPAGSAMPRFTNLLRDHAVALASEAPARPAAAASGSRRRPITVARFFKRALRLPSQSAIRPRAPVVSQIQVQGRHAREPALHGGDVGSLVPQPTRGGRRRSSSRAARAGQLPARSSPGRPGDRGASSVCRPQLRPEC